MNDFTEIDAPYWQDAPTFVIGGGSSLTDFPFNVLRERGYSIGVNFAGLRLDTDVCFTLDHGFPVKFESEIQAYIARGGEMWIAQSPSRKPGQVESAQYLQRRQGDLASHPREVFGSNSGFGAINFAVHKQSSEIYLLGFDMSPGADATHWHDAYGGSPCAYGRWLKEFRRAAPHLERRGGKVVNVIGDPASAIDVFPTMTQTEFLRAFEKDA